MTDRPEFGIHFWGIADHARPRGPEPVSWNIADFFHLSRTKSRMLYPTSLKGSYLLLSVRYEYFTEIGAASDFSIELVCTGDQQLARIDFTYEPFDDVKRASIASELEKEGIEVGDEVDTTNSM